MYLSATFKTGKNPFNDMTMQTHAPKKLAAALFAMLTALNTFQSCTMQEDGLKRSTGKTNEILVVTNTKDMWTGRIGDTLRAVFQQPVPGLPQAEPMYKVLNVSEKNLNKTFKKLHSIFIIDINPGVSGAKVEMKRDLWSEPQQVIKITAPDTASFFDTFGKYSETFLQRFRALEIERINKYFHMATSTKLKKLIMKKFGISLDVPGGFTVATSKKDFLWLHQPMHKTRQDLELGILIYRLPYKDTSIFRGGRLLDIRDSITEKYIPGPSEGSYMIVSRKVILPAFLETGAFVTGYALETRGLWEVENDFMGGPFISYAFVDPGHENVIVLDGYVYNPNNMKRNFVRQLEAIFHTLEFVDNTEEQGAGNQTARKNNTAITNH